MGHTRAHQTPEYLKLIAELVAKHKQRTYALMQLQPAHKVLDVGCGPGTDTVELGRLVGPGGQVVGIDHSPAQVDAAIQKAQAAGVDAWVLHRVADATSLPFESDTFDATRSERLFQHLHQPASALAEMIRVTRSGGWVVLLDTDWSTMSTDTPEVEIERRLAHFHANHGFASGYVGRQLYRMMRRGGLANIHVEMAPTYVTNYTIGRKGAMLDELEEAALAAGVITAEELRRWQRSLEEADAAGEYFGSINQMLVAGQKV